MVSHLGTVRIKGGGSELRLWTVSVASSLLSTQDVMKSRVHATLRITVHIFNVASIQTSVNSNISMLHYKEWLRYIIIYDIIFVLLRTLRFPISYLRSTCTSSLNTTRLSKIFYRLLLN
jgi:hypothetical protein